MASHSKNTGPGPLTGHDESTNPEPPLVPFRHKWQKELPAGRMTKEIIGSQGIDDDDDDDEIEENIEETLYPATKFGEAGQGCIEPNGATVKSEDEESSITLIPHPGIRGKKLIPWHRARVAEMLLLCIQYEAFQAGVTLPWEEAIQRLQVGVLYSSSTTQSLRGAPPYLEQ